MIDRQFARLDAGLIHYRTAGAKDLPPLLMSHAGPGSSAGLVPLIEALSATHRVIAPDMLGNGDSDPPPHGTAEIGFYADCIAQLMDLLGIPHADFYGSHTGAQVGCELAVTRPGRVRRLVLDGAALFPPELRVEFLERYAPPTVPAADGSHMTWIWEFVSGLTEHFPYYRKDEAHRILPEIILSPEDRMGLVVDMVKAWPSWHIAYGAAFRHDMRARLPLVTAPTLVLGLPGDPLAVYAAEVASLLPDARRADITRAELAPTIAAFLAQND